MKDKYNMTLEQNIFLAKRNLVDNVYANARMEGLNITFSQAKLILEGINVSNLKLDEIQCVLNLRDAWQFVINNIKTEFNIDFICKVNEYVSRNESLDCGKLRTRKSRNIRHRLYSKNPKCRRYRKRYTSNSRNRKYH